MIPGLNQITLVVKFTRSDAGEIRWSCESNAGGGREGL